MADEGGFYGRAGRRRRGEEVIVDRPVGGERDHPLEAQLGGPGEGPNGYRKGGGEEVGLASVTAIVREVFGDVVRRPALEVPARVHEGNFGHPEVAEARRIPGRRRRIVGTGQERSAHTQRPGP